MPYERFIFSQIMDFLPAREFRRIVSKYGGDYKTHRFTCWSQWLCQAFGQLTFRESLREIEDCLRPRVEQLYRLGFRGSVCRSTMAEANANRDWRIYRDFAMLLIGQARKLYVDHPIDVDLDAAVYAIDSTTVDLCLAVFPWAKFKRHKGAVKIHTQLDLRGAIPTLIHVSDGKMHDVIWLDQLVFEPGAVYIFDRGYVDFKRLCKIHQSRAFFVTRAKSNMQFYRCHSNPVEEGSGVVADQIIRLTNKKSKEHYPEKLRRIVYIDAESHRKYVFMTNYFDLPALQVAQLYKMRWQVELFFKWIKQNLRIKAFLGRESNAVKTQIWCAIATYVLLLIIRKKTGQEASMHTILTVVSVNIFEKVPLAELFMKTIESNQETRICKQLQFNY